MATFKLFKVTTTMNHSYRGYKNVQIYWFMKQRASKLPYAEILPDDVDKLLKDDADLVRVNMERMFTEDEAKALKAYLDQQHGDAGTTTIQEKTITYDGFDYYSLDGSYCSTLDNKDGALPFEVYGQYELVGEKGPMPSDVSEGGINLSGPFSEWRYQSYLPPSRLGLPIGDNPFNHSFPFTVRVEKDGVYFNSQVYVGAGGCYTPDEAEAFAREIMKCAAFARTMHETKGEFPMPEKAAEAAADETIPF